MKISKLNFIKDLPLVTNENITIHFSDHKEINFRVLTKYGTTDIYIYDHSTEKEIKEWYIFDLNLKINEKISDCRNVKKQLDDILNK